MRIVSNLSSRVSNKRCKLEVPLVRRVSVVLIKLIIIIIIIIIITIIIMIVTINIIILMIITLFKSQRI